MADIFGDLASGLKRLATIKKDMDDLQFKEIILEQKALLLDAKEEILRLREESYVLKAQIKDKDDASRRMKDLFEVEGFKYDRFEGKPKGLPYCPNCETKEEGKFYRLNRSNNFYSKCPNCATLYQVGKDGQVHVEAPRATMRTRKGFI